MHLGNQVISKAYVKLEGAVEVLEERVLWEI